MSEIPVLWRLHLAFVKGENETIDVTDYYIKGALAYRTPVDYPLLHVIPWHLLARFSIEDLPREIK
jgi:hypothetical protein